MKPVRRWNRTPSPRPQTLGTSCCAGTPLFSALSKRRQSSCRRARSRNGRAISRYVRPRCPTNCQHADSTPSPVPRLSRVSGVCECVFAHAAKCRVLARASCRRGVARQGAETCVYFIRADSWRVVADAVHGQGRSQGRLACRRLHYARAYSQGAGSLGVRCSPGFLVSIRDDA